MINDACNPAEYLRESARKSLLQLILLLLLLLLLSDGHKHKGENNHDIK